MIKAAIFDFDGTLVDSNQIKFQEFFNVVRDVPFSQEIMSSIIRSPIVRDRYQIFKKFVYLLEKNHNYAVDIQNLVDSYTFNCEKKISIMKAVKGSEKTLEWLKNNGVKVIISSATPAKTLNKIVNGRNISSSIDNIFGSPKTKEQHIKIVKKIYGLESNQIIYIGDSENDRVAALNSTCDFIGIGNDYSRFKTKPKHLIKDFELFIPLFGKLFK